MELTIENKAKMAKLLAAFYEVEEEVDEDTLRRFVEILGSDLTDREMAVISLRYGLDGNEPQTLLDVGKRFGVTREEIRQTEAKAVRKLRHPVRRNYIFGK